MKHLFAAMLVLGWSLAPRGYEVVTMNRLMVDGQQRTYELHWPDGRQGTAGLPAVIVLHGAGGNADHIQATTAFDAKADEGNFLAVYPNGSGASGDNSLTWNAGRCCGFAREKGIDDIRFLDALIEQLKQEYRVNPRGIFITGFSNGAMMAYRAACELSDKIAAIAPVSGVLRSACHPDRPVSMVIVHGTADKELPYDGGPSRESLDRTRDRQTSVAETVGFWLDADGCPLTPKKTRHRELMIQQYSGCRDGTEVKLYILIGQGHGWPVRKRWGLWGNEPGHEISATDEIWDFFKTHFR